MKTLIGILLFFGGFCSAGCMENSRKSKTAYDPANKGEALLLLQVLAKSGDCKIKLPAPRTEQKFELITKPGDITLYA